MTLSHLISSHLISFLLISSLGKSHGATIGVVVGLCSLSALGLLFFGYRKRESGAGAGVILKYHDEDDDNDDDDNDGEEYTSRRADESMTSFTGKRKSQCRSLLSLRPSLLFSFLFKG